MPDTSKAALSNIEETSAVSDEMRQQSSVSVPEMETEKSTEKVSETGSSSGGKKETEAASSERAASLSAASSKISETHYSSGDNAISTALSDADSPSASSGAVYVLHPAQTFSSPEEFATSSVAIDAYQYTIINRLDVIAVSLLISAGLLFFLVLRSINSTKR